MNWHHRYLQQAAWTSDLRGYLFDKTGLSQARRVLEVGCGTGAILSTLQTSASSSRTMSLHGLDLDAAALNEAHLHAPNALLTRGDAHSLPYSNQSFDISILSFPFAVGG